MKANYKGILQMTKWDKDSIGLDAAASLALSTMSAEGQTDGCIGVLVAIFWLPAMP